MSTKEDYVQQVEKNMSKYKDKIFKIDNLLENYKAKNNSELLGQREELKDKFDQAEQMLKKIKSASEKDYEKIKESAIEVFENIKDAFHEFSSILSMEQLHHIKEEIVDYSHEKLDEAQELFKKHPLAIAAGALGLGFIIGALFLRSK